MKMSDEDYWYQERLMLEAEPDLGPEDMPTQEEMDEWQACEDLLRFLHTPDVTCGAYLSPGVYALIAKFEAEHGTKWWGMDADWGSGLDLGSEWVH